MRWLVVLAGVETLLIVMILAGSTQGVRASAITLAPAQSEFGAGITGWVPKEVAVVPGDNNTMCTNLVTSVQLTTNETPNQIGRTAEQAYVENTAMTEVAREVACADRTVMFVGLTKTASAGKQNNDTAVNVVTVVAVNNTNDESVHVANLVATIDAGKVQAADRTTFVVAGLILANDVMVTATTTANTTTDPEAFLAPNTALGSGGADRTVMLANARRTTSWGGDVIWPNVVSAIVVG